MAGDDQRQIGEVGGEAERRAFRAGWTDQADPLAGDAVAPPGGLGIALHPAVGQHQVEAVTAQETQQFLQPAGLEHQLQFRAVEQWPHEVLDEVARQGRHGTDAQHLAGLPAAFPQGGQQLVAGGEDALRVAEGEASRLGEL